MLPRMLQTRARLQLQISDRQGAELEKGYGTFNPGPTRLRVRAARHKSKACTTKTGKWMSSIDDETLVSALTVPGTHDTAAFTLPWPFVQTQTMDIANQLDAGIRYLDLRCGLRNDVVEMVHGPTILGIRLDQLLDFVYEWLAAHMSEGLIVQIKQDRKAEASSVHFAQAIIESISLKSEFWRTANTAPTMGELRGKIQLFRRFDARDIIAYGIDVTRWQDNPTSPFTIETQHNVQITIQDHYDFTEPVPLPSLIVKKGSDVSSMLDRASSSTDPKHWFINFTSASEFNWWHQIPPREVAVGGWVGFKWEEGINPRFRAYLATHKGRHRYGIVPMDFPHVGSDDLVTALIKSNFEREKDSFHYLVRLVLLVTLVVAGVLAHTYRLEHWMIF